MKKMSKKLLAMALSVTLILGSMPFVFSASAEGTYVADGDYLYELIADGDTSTVPEGFGAADGSSNGRVWTDKSVSVNNGAFDVKLSALAQEYISTNAEVSDTKIGVDVVMILDMSASMKTNKLTVTDYDGTQETNATRTKAMTKALNEAIDTIMKANPHNRVTVCTYQAYAPAVYTELLPLDHYVNHNWNEEHPWKKGTTATASNSGTGTGEYFNYNADTVSVNTDLVTGSGAAVAPKSVSASGGTPTQVGVVNGIQGMISSLNSQEYDVERVPFVLLFTDGIPSVAKSQFSFSNTASGSFSGSRDNGYEDYTAYSILTSAYQKDQLYNAYSTYNQDHTGDSAYDVRWYNIGLGVEKTGDPAMGKAFMDPATVQDGTNKYATGIKNYITKTATGANAKYATDYVYVEGENHVYFAETSDALDTAFTNLAKDIEITSKEPGKPVINLTIEGHSAANELTFTDVIGTDMKVDPSSLVLVENGTEVPAVYDEENDIYTFEGYKAYVKIEGAPNNTLTWIIPPEEIALVTFSDRVNYHDEDGNFSYEMAEPIQLNYTVNKKNPVATDTLYEGAYAGTSALATANFAVLNDNPWFYDVELDANGSYVSSEIKTLASEAKGTNSTDTAENYYEIKNEVAGDTGALVTAGLGNNGVLIPTLKVTKTVSDTDKEVTPGQEVEYTVTVENLTDHDIDKVIISDLIPTGTTYTDGDSGVTDNGTEAELDFGKIGGGETSSLTYKVTVDENAEEGTVIPGKDSQFVSVENKSVTDDYSENPDLDLTVTAASKYSISYSWSGDIPASAVLPTDTNEYDDGAAYTIDSTYTKDTVIETKDAYGNVNGKYTFSGWDKSNGNIAGADVATSGVWTYSDVEVTKRGITYSWGDDAPDGLTPPTDNNTYVKGQSYTVDDTYTSETVVETKDAFGNVNGRWTFSGWTDSNNGTMGDGDATITGTWTFNEVTVPTGKVNYSWSGDIPAEAVLPTDSKAYAVGENYGIDTTYVAGTTVEKKNEYNNLVGKYTFSGWTDNGTGTMTEGGVSVTGVWTYEEITATTYGITYVFSGDVPVSDDITAPVDNNSYQIGESYTLDTTYKAGDKVYTYDEYGNKNGEYTFSGWSDPNNGTMVQNGSVITGNWTFSEIEVPERTITYTWGDDAPAGVTLPVDGNTYVKGQSYTVDDTYTPGTKVETKDGYGNVNGEYTFSGWTDSGDGTVGDGDVTITGTWTFEEKEVPQHTITYSWGDDAPEGAALPTDNNTYVKGQTYDIDNTYNSLTTVETKDAYGNVNGVYTFSGWTDSGNGTVGDDDVTITGTWSFEEKEVPQRTITYTWGDDAPAGVTLPTDENTYVKGQPYDVDDTYTSSTTVETKDEYGNVTGVYTFSGWTDSGDGTVGDGDVTITGTWSFEEKEVPQRTITYSWGDNAPEGVTLPVDNNTYVKGQSYTVDDTYTSATKVETKDEYGNVTGVYTFSGWTDSDNGTVGDGNVTVTGTWTYTPKDVDTNIVTFTPADPETDKPVVVPDNKPIKIDPNGGEWTDPDGNTHTTETEIVITDDTDIDDATKDGYTFTGWEVTDDGSETTLTAQFKKNYAVTYVYNGETPAAANTAAPADSTIYFEGDTVTALNPAATVSVESSVRWTFNGWDKNTKEVTDSDIQFVGTWTKDLATKVTYDMGTDVPDGFPTVTDDNDYYDGDTITTNKDVDEGTVFDITDDDGNVVEQWIFQGWDVPDGTEVTPDDGTEITIKPVWAKSDVTYNVTYKYEGEAPAAANTAAPTDSEDYINGTTITPVNPAATVSVENSVKWTFNGWDADSKKIKDGNIEFVGTWTKDTATKIVYDPDGDNIKDFPDVTDDKDYYDGDSITTNKDIDEGTEFDVTDDDGTVIEKWTFEGWDVPDGTKITPDDGEEITIKPIWSKKSNYTVTYTWTGDIPVTDGEGNYVEPDENGTKLTAPVNNGRYFEGESYGLDTSFATAPDTTVYEVKDEFGNVKGKYTFSGWSNTNNGVMGTADMTLAGTWTYETIEVKKGGLVYEFTGDKVPATDNNGEPLTPPVDDKIYTNGESFTLSDKYEGLTVNHYDQYGNVDGVYTFDGWTSDSADGKMDEDGVVITGNWSYTDVEVPVHSVVVPGLPEGSDIELVNNEKIIIDPNSGIWSHNGTKFTDTVTLTVTEDMEVTDPAREGYTFTEWTVTETNGIKTLVANWNRNTGIVTFTPDGNNKPGEEETFEGSQITVDPSSGEWTYNDETYTDPAVITVDGDITLPDPTRDGYTFTGWDVEKDDDGNITFTAKWEEDSKNATPLTPSDFIVPAVSGIIPAITIGGITAAIAGGAVTSAIVAGSIVAVPVAIIGAVIAKKVIDNNKANNPGNNGTNNSDGQQSSIPDTGSDSTLAIVLAVILVLAVATVITVVVVNKKKKHNK